MIFYRYQINYKTRNIKRKINQTIKEYKISKGENMKIRIKWKNLCLSIIFIICILLVLNDLIKITFYQGTLTFYGAITLILLLITIDIVGEYLYDEMH